MDNAKNFAGNVFLREIYTLKHNCAGIYRESKEVAVGGFLKENRESGVWQTDQIRQAHRSMIGSQK